MKISTFFGVVAAAPAILGALLLGGKGCVQAIIPDDDQKGMKYVGRVTDNIFDDLEEICRAIGANIKDTPELKGAMDTLSGTVERGQKFLEDNGNDRNPDEDEDYNPALDMNSY